jgi:serine/threonine protein kinase
MTSGSNSAGNPRYMAPERILATTNMRRTAASDVYAFACVCLFVSLALHG